MQFVFQNKKYLTSSSEGFFNRVSSHIIAHSGPYICSPFTRFYMQEFYKRPQDILLHTEKKILMKGISDSPFHSRVNNHKQMAAIHWKTNILEHDTMLDKENVGVKHISRVKYMYTKAADIQKMSYTKWGFLSQGPLFSMLNQSHQNLVVAASWRDTVNVFCVPWFHL